MEKTELVFLFIKEPGKGRASNRLIKLQTALEQISMEGRSPHDTESALSLLKSGQYTSNYLIINPDHQEREERMGTGSGWPWSFRSSCCSMGRSSCIPGCDSSGRDNNR